jgi:hypothetical protein
MSVWSLEESDLKRYPHFDPWISRKEATAIATSERRVAAHPFFPFIRYIQRHTRFAEKGQKGEEKTRPIRYAARADAYIFSYYRHLLSERYEIALKAAQLDQCVLAYRKIPDENGKGGKCNIHFARDAFIKIRQLGTCCVIASDISGFFEHLDHARLKALWCRMLGVRRLPDDHFQVFKAITKYSVVDKLDVYERLGYFGVKRTSKSGARIYGYLKPFRDMPTQLCNGAGFREKIAGGDGNKSLIAPNFKSYGVPQGAAISDLLANLYLIDFDKEIAGRVSLTGGCYFRYSDDIIVILRGGLSEALSFLKEMAALIKTHGSNLELKGKKTSVHVVEDSGSRQIIKLAKGTQGRNGIEYLGFRYDGRRIYIRDSTLSNLQRKIARSARRSAFALVRRYPDKSLTELQSLFNYEHLVQKFGRVREFGELNEEYRSWTFWTYARRAAKLLGKEGQPILRQLKNHRKNIYHRANYELSRATSR